MIEDAGMKKYYRVIFYFGIGIILIASTGAIIFFLQAWLPANGLHVSRKLFVGISFGALGGAFAIGANLCLREVKRIRRDDVR